MKGIAFLSGFISVLITSGVILPASSQVTSDNTTNTTVTSSGNNFNILNGIQKGNNLFHSFKEFSIPTGGSATFQNSSAIENIINRVTGGNISNIDGLIKASGNANLFLINPSGIVFGENAKLDIGGSFIGSTAESLLFEDGFNYSAIDSEQEPLLTVSVPLGLQMGTNPGNIILQGNGSPHSQNNGDAIRRNPITSGLKVSTGKTLALFGGNIKSDGGVLVAEKGRVELAGIGANGIVEFSEINSNGNFNYSAVNSFQNIELDNKSLVDVSGNRSGTIHLQAREIYLYNNSTILSQNTGTLETSGTVTVAATELLSFAGSDIISQASTTATGSSSSIMLEAPKISLLNGSVINTTNFGKGASGDVTVKADESVVVGGFNIEESNVSNITTNSFGSGKAGNLTLQTENLYVFDGGIVGSGTFSDGKGGNVKVDANDILVENISPLGISAITSTAFGSGDAGNVSINTETLVARNGGSITSSGVSQGNGGNLSVNATESVLISGSTDNKFSELRSSINVPSPLAQMFLGLSAEPSGNAGNIIINSPQIIVTNRGRISVRNQGKGNAGSLQLIANRLDITNQGGIFSSTQSGNGGNLDLQLQDALLMRYGGIINSESFNVGNGGNISINSPLIAGFENSDIIANAVEGNGGNINIKTQGIFGLEFAEQLTQESDITASSEFGINGMVEINNVNIDPNSGLVELPSELTDSSQQIAQGCSSGNDNSFIATGRGGIPQNPSQLLNLNSTWSDIRDLSTSRKPNNSSDITSISKKSAIVEATGFIRNSKGEIELVAVENTALTIKQASECSKSHT